MNHLSSLIYISGMISVFVSVHMHVYAHTLLLMYWNCCDILTKRVKNEFQVGNTMTLRSHENQRSGFSPSWYSMGKLQACSADQLYMTQTFRIAGLCSPPLCRCIHLACPTQPLQLWALWLWAGQLSYMSVFLQHCKGIAVGMLSMAVVYHCEGHRVP